MKEEEILMIQPFQEVVGRIQKVESLLGPTATSGETFKITSTTGKKYKLRYCRHLIQARRIERNVKLFLKAFPAFYGRQGRFVLFDWIDGETLGREIKPDVCYRVGKLLGEAHALEIINQGKDPHYKFKDSLKKLKRCPVFNEQTIARIELRYQQLKSRLKLDLVLEFGDVHEKNLMIDKKGRVYFVDEDAFGYQLKGTGLAKPLIIQSWIKWKEQQEAFWSGYNEHHSDSYFDLDYQRFAAFLHLLKTIAFKLETKRDYSQEKEIILQML